MAKRKKYTQEFRDSAVKLITEQGYQITEAARNLGINATIQIVIGWRGAIFREHTPSGLDCA